MIVFLVIIFSFSLKVKLNKARQEQEKFIATVHSNHQHLYMLVRIKWLRSNAWRQPFTFFCYEMPEIREKASKTAKNRVLLNEWRVLQMYLPNTKFLIQGRSYKVDFSLRFLNVLRATCFLLFFLLWFHFLSLSYRLQLLTL